LIDKLYSFYMFTLSNNLPIINRVSTYKKELNAIKKK
jgi:hypothetical protein